MTRARDGKWLFRLSVAVLAVTGLGQMPIFKRYYLADIPGLGFLGDFYLMHLVHYVAAAVFLFLLFRSGTARLARHLSEERTVIPQEWVVGLILVLLVFTGFLRVIKNYPLVALSPGQAMFADIAHLGAALLYGLASVLLRTLRPGHMTG